MSAAVATVLAVEDDPIVRADLRLVLEDAGFAVSHAGDGAEAIELARVHEPDAILLDLALPGLDGVEATRRILAERDVPIVALTGRSRELAQQAVEAGAASYVLKPFHPDEVVEAIHDALATRAVRLARNESRRAIADLLELLDHPAELALAIEERAFQGGKVWRRVS
jgi:CheY-like chemotaxis protein